MQIVHAQVVCGPQDLATHLGRSTAWNRWNCKPTGSRSASGPRSLPPEDLLDHIRNFGARVRMFQPEAMELETAFMKLTEGKTA